MFVLAPVAPRRAWRCRGGFRRVGERVVIRDFGQVQRLESGMAWAGFASTRQSSTCLTEAGGSGGERKAERVGARTAGVRDG